jgi:maleylpyruvate isomerase
MSDDLDPQSAFELLPEATQRLVRTVDRLDDEALAAPSGLPGWTRGHVVAHLALNAEGMAAVLDSRA